MNHRVPAHEPEDDPNARRKLPDDELFELIWRNGPVLQQLAGDRARGWSPPDMGGAAAPSTVEAKELFIEEDEMALWLHYDIGGGDIYGDLLESSAPASVSASHESPVVESNESQAKMLPEARTCERAVTSPSGERANPPPEEARKRKRREDVDSEYDHSEEAEFRSGDKRKGACQSALPKRTRAAEVHNLSERRRRDKINEKMKALQELIPRCNKSDKASMLDEAIEYLKSLQLQVQMMSMGCNMGPMMFPGVQTYLPSMGMGMVMGMPMGRDMHPNGLGHPMLQYGSLLSCHPMVGPSRPAHLLPRPVMPAFHPPRIAVQASNLQDPVSNSIGMLGPNMVQIPNIVDQYHRYPGVHQLRNQE